MVSSFARGGGQPCPGRGLPVCPFGGGKDMTVSLWPCQVEPEASSRMQRLWPRHVLKSRAACARQGRAPSSQGNQPGGSFPEEFRFVSPLCQGQAQPYINSG